MKIGFMIWEMFNGYFVHSKAKSMTKDKEKVDLICISGCTNDNHKWNNQVVVDGNDDSTGIAQDSTWCFDQQPCVFKPKGER